MLDKLEEIVEVSLVFAGFLFLLYKFNAPFLSSPKWCDYCALFWSLVGFNIVLILADGVRYGYNLIAFPESILAYYIFLRIYHGTSVKR